MNLITNQYEQERAIVTYNFEESQDNYTAWKNLQTHWQWQETNQWLSGEKEKEYWGDIKKEQEETLWEMHKFNNDVSDGA